ncbi:MAG: DNA-directed DNA polymerase I [Desulfurococcales archaeon]|nr:DNA-directed DNA polymerase I [Desulfurococcales archaeon]
MARKRRRLDDFIAELIKEVERENGVGGDSNSRSGSRGAKTRRGKSSILDFLETPNTRRRTRPPLKPQDHRVSQKEIAPSRAGHEPQLNSPRTTQVEEEDGRTKRRAEPAVQGQVPVKRVVVGGSRHHTPLKSLKEPRPVKWLFGEMDDIVQEAVGYVMEVKYDPQPGKAVIYIYDPAKGSLQRWFDRSGHKPYFLVDAKPGPELKSTLARDEADKLIVGFETVVKFHPIKRSKVKLTKVIVNDPLAVRRLRDAAKAAGLQFYEADIRYHHNYIYDKHLVPGMYHIASRDIALKEHRPDKEFVVKVLEAFSDEPEEVRNRAVNWIPLFEQEPPNPRKVALDIEVYSPFESELPDPENASFPVVSVALVDDSGRKRLLLLDRDDVPVGEGLLDLDAEVEVFDSEIGLILEVFRSISSYPIIVTFNGDNFDIPYLYNRLITLGVSADLIPIEFHQDYAGFRNALHIDLYKLFDIRALQVYAFGNKYRERNLDAIAEALLGKKKVVLERPISEIDLSTLALYNLTDSELTMGLLTYNNMLVWNLIVLLMRVSKLGVEDVTRTQVSGWIKSLIHWEHRRRGYLIPGKEEISRLSGTPKSQAIIKDKKYKGAIVLKPLQGVFFNILVLDFASLYPSVIKNWNLSYETVNNPYCNGEKRIVPEVEHEVCMSIRGLTSEIIGMLRDFRVKIYKKMAKDKSLPETLRMWYNVVQAAMKVYINASYGVFGNENFSYYSLAVAESVTAIGRAVLKDTLEKARELGLIILYGDTDSLFVWDPPKEELTEIIRYVKEKHGLDLEIDKEFKLALFSGLKKNYISVTPEGEVVIKGMVGKKSNTPEFIKKEFQTAVKILAEISTPEDLFDAIDKLRVHVSGILKKLKRRQYMLDELAIKVMLAKDPREYVKNTPQHVKAALLLKKYGLRITRGTVVTFVKTKDKLGVRPVKLARLPEVDTNKYTEYVKTVFEQMLLSLGISWNKLLGQRRLLFASE